MSTKVVNFKQGTSFGLTATYTQDSPSAPADLTGVVVKSAVRDAGYNYFPLVVTVTSPTTFTAVYPGDTIGWVVGSGYFDLRLEYGTGSVFYTESVSLNVLPSITGTMRPTNPQWA